MKSNARDSSRLDPCIGLVESKSIARGLEAADAMAKEASVAVVFTRIIEPGRHLTLVSGPVDDVRQALRRACSIVQDDLADELFLPNAHPSLFEGLQAARRPGALRALGLIECATVSSALLAADAAAKEARVEVFAIRIGTGMGGKGLVGLTGEVADVDSAVIKASTLAEQRGTLVRTTVIPRPVERMLEAVLAG